MTPGAIEFGRAAGLETVGVAERVDRRCASGPTRRW